MISDEVTGVDFSSKKVSTKSGESYPYTKLVLAMGGTPKMLPLPGFKELNNVFLLRTIPDVQDILGAVGDKGKKIVVIGSSFIGMEVANCLSKENTVTVVGMEKAPLERVMGEEVGNIFKSILEKNGVKFQMEAGVDKATPASSNSKTWVPYISKTVQLSKLILSSLVLVLRRQRRSSKRRKEVSGLKRWFSGQTRVLKLRV
jgi:NAD(P)H-nitrite reductase large subunit